MVAVRVALLVLHVLAVSPEDIPATTTRTWKGAVSPTATTIVPSPEALALGAPPNTADPPQAADQGGLQDGKDDDEYDDEYDEEYDGEGDSGDTHEDPDGEEEDYEEDYEEEEDAVKDAPDDDDDGGDEDEKEGAGDGEVQGRVDEDIEDDLGEVEVRSLSQLPLSKLLRVQSELRRLSGHLSGSSTDTCRKDQCDSKAKPQPAASRRRWLPGDPNKDLKATAPSAQPFNWGGSSGSSSSSSSTSSPIRRGGAWSSHEEWEEEEEEDGWISWNKGKKKGKGDIGSVFQVAVTFLAFLAFGGYLLCLIMQAIKGGGYGYYYPYGQQGQLRPANLMMVMMPTRLANRRPTRPAAATGRRRRRRGADPEKPEHSWWPGWGEEQLRALPHVDADRMHRALLVLAEGYASFYHKRFSQQQ